MLTVTRTESYSMETLTVRSFDSWLDLVDYLAGYGIPDTGLEFDSQFTRVESIWLGYANVPIKVIYKIELQLSCM